MKIVLNILKILVTVILTVSIILLLLINIATSTILSKEYMVGKLEETNYYANIYTQVKSNFKKYIYQSGLDESVIEDIISAKEVKNDIDSIIDNIYDGKNIEIDYSNLKENLSSNIDEYLESENIRVTTETQDAIDKFIEKIVDEYKNTIFHTNYEDNAYNMIIKVVSVITIAKTVLTILIVILSILLLLFNIKTIAKTISYIGIALTSSGVFYIIVEKFINSKITIDNIMLLNDSTTITLRYILNSIVSSIRTLGYQLLASGIVLIIISSIICAFRKEKTTN